MSDPVPVNTPQTLGVTPRYILQHNAVCRSAHTLSATAQKLTVMAMALLPTDLSSLTASFTFPEFCKAIGFEKGGASFKVFLDALKECVNSSISLEITSEKTGKKKWKNYTWFVSSDFDEETGIATMTFSPQLASVLLELKWVYTKIGLRPIGKLQSKYAIRLFQIALSYASLKGKNGNQKGVWYFERSIQDIRFIFGIPDDRYQETRLFCQRVIKDPVEELNAAALGFTVKTEKIKDGRTLIAIRFDCEEAPAMVTAKRRDKTPETVALPLPFTEAHSLADKEAEQLKALYAEEYAQLYADLLKESPPNAFLKENPRFWERQAAHQAYVLLKARYGIRK